MAQRQEIFQLILRILLPCLSLQADQTGFPEWARQHQSFVREQARQRCRHIVQQSHQGLARCIEIPGQPDFVALYCMTAEFFGDLSAQKTYGPLLIHAEYRN